MSVNITIGKYDEGGATKLKRDRLLVTRGLVTSDSGGGKSYLLRKILEAVSLTTQTIVIDPEGEYASLREIRDMVLVGPDGELPAEPRSAGLLCRRLMELHLSAVIDLSELTLRQRQEFVGAFCSTMVELPKSLWHPCIVAVDEAHESAPEDDKTVSAGPLALLSVKGRKRGYCLLGATTRLSNLSKNVAGGLKNQFLGTFSLDTDIKRAAASLGFGKDRWPEIRDLSSEEGKEGEFFCVGPAFNRKGVHKMRASEVESSHPKVGQGKRAKPPAPSKKILGVLDELKDLPQEAEQEIKDLAAAKAKITELERELRRRPTERVTSARTVEVSSKRDQQIIARLRAGLEEAMKIMGELKTKAAAAAVAGGGVVDEQTIRGAVDMAVGIVLKAAAQKQAKERVDWDKTRREVDRSLERARQLLGATSSNGAAAPPASATHARAAAAAAPTSSRAVHAAPTRAVAEDFEEEEEEDDDVEPAEGLSKTQQRALNALAWWASVGVDSVSREQLGAVAGIGPQGGYLDRVLAVPSSLGHITRSKGSIELTNAGRKVAIVPKATPDLTSYHKKLRAVIKNGASRKVLDALRDAGPRDWTREEIGEATGISPQGGYLDRVLAPLSAIGVIDRAKGMTTPTKLLFPDELI